MKQRFTKRTRLVSALLTLAMVFTFLPVSAFAATDDYGPVYISDTTFPDETFQNYVKQFDENNNGTLSPEERYKVTEISVPNKNISNLYGIQFFPNLVKLDCDQNNLSSLDVSQNPALKYLYCEQNNLSSLDVSSNSALKYLHCTRNNLSSLDVSQNLALEYLLCAQNKLTSLDVSKNEALKLLNCKNNQLTNLNVEYTNINPSVFLSELLAQDNTYPITVGSDRTFNLSTLPGKFEVSKADNWVDGTVSGNTLKVKEGATQVTYTYDCGKGLSETFTLNVEVIPEGSIKQVNLRVNTPKKGKMPDETVVILDNGADVCDAKIRWGMGDIGGEPIPGSFQAGKRYTLQVGLYAKPGYKFSKDTVCTVNGRETEFIWTQNDDTEYCAIKHYSVSLNPGGFEHDHKMEMTHDEYSHWMECPICHTVQDTEGHVYDDDKDTTCNVCGYVRSLTPGGGSTIPPEAGKYQLTVIDGFATVNDGSTGAVLNVKPGDTVTLTADTTKFPENEEFGWWEITPYGSVSNTLTGQYQRTATFTMPSENVSARAMSKSAGVSTGGDDGGGGGGAAILLVGGAAVAGLVGYGVYSYVSEQQLKALLPEGVAMPENRAQTALLLWNTAGRPEPAEAPAFKDVADPDTAKAAQWCVEHGLMDQKLGGRFAPDNSDPAYKTLNAYQQLVG